MRRAARLVRSDEVRAGLVSWTWMKVRRKDFLCRSWSNSCIASVDDAEKFSWFF